MRTPFEAVLLAFLDFLYSDTRETGVTGRKHAKALFRRWLELSVTHDREQGGALVPYFTALMPFYPEASELRAIHRTQDPLRRKDAEQAMRTAFEELLLRYLRQLYNDLRTPGIRDEAHARETFVTFLGLLRTYQDRDH